MKSYSKKFLSSVAIMVILLLSCHQEMEDVSQSRQGADAFLNPYVTGTPSSRSGRVNPYTGDGVGIAEQIGPVIVPAGGFHINSHYDFAEGDEFLVDVALGKNNKLAFFISGTHTIVSKTNGEEQRPDEITEAFAFDGMVYAWGSRSGQALTWTIGFVKNHIEIREGHVGMPLELITTLTSVNPEATRINSPAITFEFTANDSRAGFDCSLNGSAPAPCVSPITYSGLIDGAYTFVVHAVLEGRQDQEGVSHDWFVDTVPPFITFIATTTTTSTIQIDWTTSEPTTAGLEWGLSPIPENLVPESSDYQTSRSILLTDLKSASVYYFYIWGKDEAGNAYRSSRFSSATRRE